MRTVKVESESEFCFKIFNLVNYNYPYLKIKLKELYEQGFICHEIHSLVKKISVFGVFNFDN